MKNITAKTPCRAITALAIAGAFFVAYHNPARAAPTKTDTYKPAEKPADKPEPLNDSGFKDGFYVRPNAELLFIDQLYTRGRSTLGMGGGFGIDVGYRWKSLLFDIAMGYQYYDDKGSTGQTFSATGNGALVRSLIPEAANAVYVTTADNHESFIPITLGIKYSFSILGNNMLNLTPGIAGGLWFHVIKRDLSYSDDQGGVVAERINNLSRSLGAAVPAHDNASQARGVIVPSLALDYNPTSNITLSLTGKFFIVPGGYSDNYSKNNQTAAEGGADTFAINYTEVNKLFWYGGFNLALQYIF